MQHEWPDMCPDMFYPQLHLISELVWCDYCCAAVKVLQGIKALFVVRNAVGVRDHRLMLRYAKG